MGKLPPGVEPKTNKQSSIDWVNKQKRERGEEWMGKERDRQQKIRDEEKKKPKTQGQIQAKRAKQNERKRRQRDKQKSLAKALKDAAENVAVGAAYDALTADDFAGYVQEVRATDRVRGSGLLNLSLRSLFGYTTPTPPPPALVSPPTASTNRKGKRLTPKTPNIINQITDQSTPAGRPSKLPAAVRRIIMTR